MKYAVVIPSLYEADGEYLKLCVESLRESGFDGSIIVVTNGTKHKPNLDDIQGISVHLHNPAQGQCSSVNIGAQVVPPDVKYMLVSNADMYYAPGWDKHLPEQPPLVFSPNLVEPTNNPGSAPPFLKVDGGFTLDEFDRDKVNHFIKTSREKAIEPGFNLPFFVNLDVWRTTGGYDDKFDPWGSNSDTDLQTKFNLAGITPVRLRDVLVYHFSNKSGTFDGSHQEAWQKNWDYFDQKWGFNRDILGSDVWYNTKMLPENLDDSKYQPDWVNRYEA